MNTKEDILKKVCIQAALVQHWLNKYIQYYGSQWWHRTVQFPKFFKISLCSTEQRDLYRFGTTWRWVKD